MRFKPLSKIFESQFKLTQNAFEKKLNNYKILFFKKKFWNSELRILNKMT